VGTEQTQHTTWGRGPGGTHGSNLERANVKAAQKLLGALTIGRESAQVGSVGEGI
jgi:hypothetical protein